MPGRDRDHRAVEEPVRGSGRRRRDRRTRLSGHALVGAAGGNGRKPALVRGWRRRLPRGAGRTPGVAGHHDDGGRLLRRSGLPATLRDVPIEIAAEASRDLRQQSELDAAPIVVGVSRGSELALLAAGSFPTGFAAVIGIAPSSRVHGVAGSTLENPVYPWTLDHQRIELLSSIPTDCVPGPILLLSGEDDRLIPTPTLAERALALRGDHGHRLDEHVCYRGAGHTFFGQPGVPTADPADARHPATGQSLVVGGTRRANALAGQQAWDKLLDFINRVVGIGEREVTQIHRHQLH